MSDMIQYAKIISFCIMGCLLISSCKKEKPIIVIEKGAFTVSPVNFNEFVGLVPLGAMNPPGHTFPTDHMYFYYKNPGTTHNIMSPGNLTITTISRARHDVGKPGETQDYSIEFGSNNGTLFYYYHVATLSKKLENAVNNFSGANCESYKINGVAHESCKMIKLSIDVNAGEIIGTGGNVPGQFALDMGMRVNGIAVCPLDYFEPNLKQQLENRLSNYDGTKKKKGTPLCGEVNQDITGTAQGNWYKKGFPKYPEDQHIALVKDFIDPAIPIFSIGNGLTGQTPGYYTFLKLNFGYINRPFADVKADGKVYCYNLKQFNGMLIPNTSLILKLENDHELSIEKRNCDCSCQPFLFTNNKVEFNKGNE